jgi:hypothetical protein
MHQLKKKQKTFAKKYLEKRVQHNDTSYWINNQCQKNPSMEWSPVLRKMLQWKAPGRDQIANFWLKQPTATHTYLETLCNKLIEEGQIPNKLTAGITILIPQDENNERLKNYRPITCLHTIYKTIRST